MALESLTRVLVGIAWDSAHEAPASVSFSQFRLLLVAGRIGPVSCSRLASAMGVNASSVTRLADRLEANGFVARSRSAQKRSAISIEVTDAGRRVVAEVLDRRHAALRSILEQVPAERRASVAEAAALLVEAAAAEPAHVHTGQGPL